MRAQFLSILLTALAFVPGGAHLLELPNKMALGQADYFTVQQIYRGWALLGVVLVAALAANLLLAVLLRRRPAFGFAVAAFLLVAAALVVFFVWVYPVNVATRNWTAAPADWASLRAQWEGGHAASAALLFLALCASLAAGLRASNA